MKKKNILLIDILAQDDINQAYQWYEEQQDGLGEDFLNSLENAFNRICKTPNGFQQIKNHRQYPLKHFPFVILYEHIDNKIFIDAVFHTSRNPTSKRV
jgi:plasmid stabilization system protein ParE